jgi:pyruvate/2-oxoglutarate/acetoin dehydrogenase E1 component
LATRSGDRIARAREACLQSAPTSADVAGYAGMVLCALGQLDAAWRLTTADLPIPYSPPLEDAFLPQADAIVESVRAHLGG